MKKLSLVLALSATAALVLYAAQQAHDYSKFSQPLTSQDQKILHALDRLTFGPRPGDLEAVRKMGIGKWIDLQLHPGRIKENPELAQLLAPLETLHLDARETAQNYPPPGVVLAMASGLKAMPTDPEARARIELQAARAKQLKQAKQDGGDLQGMIGQLQGNGPVPGKGAFQGKGKGKAKGGPPPQERRQQVIAAMDPTKRRETIANSRPQQVINYDLNEGKLYRAVYSERQLEEVLTDFWFNHFNVFLNKGADRILTASYERDAIRPYVLGKFRDLLGATAASPAMLFYLDNWQSVDPNRAQQTGRFLKNAKLKAKAQGRGLNENYARELMELHTLGVDGGYTQQDIIEVARAFTGWTIRQPQQGGEFFFNARMHDQGEKTVLGVKIPPGGGQEDGEKVLDLLAKHPSTAHFISLELAQRFVADDPPPALVDRMAATFTKTDGDIREVLAAMFGSPEFFSEGAYRAKVKTPLELVVSAVRATGTEVNYAIPLSQQIAQLGQPLYQKVEPTGYPMAASEWVNSAALLARMNFALALTASHVPGASVTRTYSADPGETFRQILFREPSKQTLESIQHALAGKHPTPEMVAGLVLGSPDFQRR